MSIGQVNSPDQKAYHQVTNGSRSSRLQSLNSARERSPGTGLINGLSDSLRQLRRIGGEVVDTLKAAGSPLEASIRRLALRPDRRDWEVIKLFDLFDITEGMPANGAPYGLSFGGIPLLLDYCDPGLAVVLVTGAGGSGKSHLLRSLAYSLALTARQSQLQLLAISPAYGRERYGDQQRLRHDPMAALDYLPHMLAPVNYELEDAAETLALLADEFDYREGAGVELPYIILIIDDLDLLLEEGGSAIGDPLSRLLEIGPAYGFRLLAGVPHPAPPVLDQLIGQEAGLRLVGRLESAEEEEGDEGISGTRAEYFLEAGEFVAVSPGVVTPFQAGYLDGHDLRIAAEVLHQPTGQVLLAQDWPETVVNSPAIDGKSTSGEAIDSTVEPEVDLVTETPGKDQDEDGLALTGKTENQRHTHRGSAGRPGPTVATGSKYERWEEEQVDPDDWLDDEPLPFDPDD